MDAISLALRASEERLRHLVEHAQDLIYYCDPRGFFTFVNPSAARTMHFPEDELIGRHFLTLIHPDYRAQAGAHYARQLSERIPTTYFEFPAVTKDGTVIWIGQHVQLVISGESVTAVHAIARDITRQRAAEDRLRESEGRYRSLVEGAVYGIFRTAVDGTILEVNPALAQMLGYDSVDEVMALNMSSIYKAKEDRAALIDRYNRTRNPSLSTDVTWLRRDGSEIIVHLAARRVHNEDGSFGFEGIAEDITEKRAFEDQLQRAQKMEAVGLLARGVAHDFNNVLAAILGTADLLALRFRDDQTAREDADEIRKSAERGAALTKQLLAFSRSQTLAPKRVQVAQTVSRMHPTLERLCGPLCSFEVRLTAAPTPVSIDLGQLEQVILNLVVNARDAMPSGGDIRVDVAVVEIDDRVSFRYGVPPGPYVRIAVTDTGPGIDPDLQPRIFEPFFTTKGNTATGLGLSIVYGIARGAGGAVLFESVEGEGTTFEVVLPTLSPEP